MVRRDDLEELQTRVSGGGFSLKEGPITEKVVLPFRSFVAEPMRYGRLFLAGDAAPARSRRPAPRASTWPCRTSRVLAEVLDAAVNLGKTELLETYGPRALERVWKAQQFSYRMTTLRCR